MQHYHSLYLVLIAIVAVLAFPVIAAVVRRCASECAGINGEPSATKPDSFLLVTVPFAFSVVLESLRWIESKVELHVAPEQRSVIVEWIDRAREAADDFEIEHVQLMTHDDDGAFDPSRGDYDIRREVRLPVSLGVGRNLRPDIMRQIHELDDDEKAAADLPVAMTLVLNEGLNAAAWLKWHALDDASEGDDEAEDNAQFKHASRLEAAMLMVHSKACRVFEHEFAVQDLTQFPDPPHPLLSEQFE